MKDIREQLAKIHILAGNSMMTAKKLNGITTEEIQAKARLLRDLKELDDLAVEFSIIYELLPECHCGSKEFTEDGVCLRCPHDCPECA